jgi:response regulator NasT
MQDISGLEAAKGISLTHPTPIILTEKNNHKFKESAKITGVMAYLVRPFNKKELVSNIEIAIYRFKEHEALLRDNADLKEQLKARKIIEKAKGILMRKYSVNEKEAFRKIQKASMNKHVTMKEIAESIIMASDLENQSL